MAYFFFLLMLQGQFMENQQACYVIRKIPVMYKKPRPHEAKQTYPERYCLLNVCPEKYGEVARRVIQVYWEGKKEWREFEVAREFETEQEAVSYAEQHKIAIDLTVRVQGTAQNAKQGAVIITEKGLAYYLADKNEWEDAEINQVFRIEGILRQEVHDEKLLLDKEGNYSAGAVGKQLILEDWHKVE